MNAGTVPGVVAIGATDKGVVYEGAFGPSITADSVFWIASMTKAVTATAAMQLVEQGKLQLDQPMGKLLPQLESPESAGRIRRRRGAETSSCEARDHAAASAHSYGWLHLQHLERADDPIREGHGASRVLASARTPRSTRRSNSIPVNAGNTASTWTGSARRWKPSAISRWRSISARISSRRLGMTDTGFLIGSAQKARVAPMSQREHGRDAEADGVRNAAAP